MVVLELGGLEDRPSLLVAVMFSLIIYIENRMYRTPRNLKKLNVIDEGWRLLDFKNHKVGEFIEKGYRTARRHTGAYITITQNIVDFDSDKASSAARAAWGNSSYKIILKQSAKEFAKYNQLYHPGNPAGYCPANEGGTMRCRGLIALLIWGQSVAAADLGTWGDLWPVKEPDMLTVIMQRLTALEQSGEMGRKMDAFKERVIRNSLRPPAVPSIGRTEKYGSRLFDPSVRLAADIRDNEGRVFARQGEVMNPLQYVPFNQTLYFINGDDPAQVAWMKRQTPPILESKIILVQGSIPEMQKSLDSRVYFDQNGVLCQRLGIDQVPARVSAVPGDRFLKVEFIPAEEGRK